MGYRLEIENDVGCRRGGEEKLLPLEHQNTLLYTQARAWVGCTSILSYHGPSLLHPRLFDLRSTRSLGHSYQLHGETVLEDRIEGYASRIVSVCSDRHSRGRIICPKS